MVVRLRLARHGTKKNPFYHVVAIRDKAPRDARPIEKLGEYDPIPRLRPTPLAGTAAAATTAKASIPKGDQQLSPYQLPSGIFTSGIQPTEANSRLEKRLEWNSERITHWLKVGAQPSRPVANLLARAGLIPPGKIYKSMYQPPPAAVKQAASSPSSSARKASPSAILRAAGVTGAPLGGKAASAEDQSKRPTDPTVEARRQDAGTATPSQAQ